MLGKQRLLLKSQRTRHTKKSFGDIRKNSALSGYRWTRPFTGESAVSCNESRASFGWSGTMSDFIGRNWRTIGSWRGSSQLTRLRTCGLQKSLSVHAGRLVCAGQDTRHADCHGCGGHAVHNILDELVTALHLRARPIQGNTLGDDCLKELEELGCALDRVGNLYGLRLHSARSEIQTAGVSRRAYDLHPSDMTESRQSKRFPRQGLCAKTHQDFADVPRPRDAGWPVGYGEQCDGELVAPCISLALRGRDEAHQGHR